MLSSFRFQRSKKNLFQLVTCRERERERAREKERMKTGYVYRKGRTRRVTNSEMKGRAACMNNFCLPMFAVVTLVGGSFHLFSTEKTFVLQQEAFEMVEDSVVTLNNNGWEPRDGDRVHVTDEYDATGTDEEFGIFVPHSIKLDRKTEYCQWKEHTTTECETCEREDDEGNKETYSCNCVETYHYTKTWRTHRVNSILFDQPANHHNPQRDPFPSKSLSAMDMSVKAGNIGISQSVVNNFRGPTRPLVFTHGGRAIPRDGIFERMYDWAFGAPPVPRFEPVRTGLGSGFLDSYAHTNHKFVYTNHKDGWFFSPYEASTLEKALRGFGQFLEGSLFDWQLGDLIDIFAGCTPGDIRVRYDVADPRDVSAIGLFSGGQIVPLVVSNGFEIGILHAGAHDIETMFSNESKEQHWLCKVARFVSFFCGLSATYILNKSGIVKFSLFLRASLGFHLLLVSFVWFYLYGIQDFSGWDTDAWTIAFTILGTVLITTSVGGSTKSAKQKEA